MKTEGMTDAERIHNSLGHNLRTQILRLAAKAGEFSPATVASETTESLGLVSYHTRQLEQYGALEPVRTEPRRGATQHYYRLTDLGKHAIAIDKATTRRLASEVRAGV